MVTAKTRFGFGQYAEAWLTKRAAQWFRGRSFLSDDVDYKSGRYLHNVPWPTQL